MNQNNFNSSGYTGSSSSCRPQLSHQPSRPSYQQPYTPDYRRGSASMTSLAVPTSRNNYDVDSMLQPRSIPNRGYGQGWDRHSRMDASPTYATGRRGSDVSRLQSQYTRIQSPFRDHHSYTPNADQPSPPRREYSPLRKVSKGLDGVFKGFTTPLPGNDPGYMTENPNLMDHHHGGSVRSASIRRYSEVDHASAYRGLSAAGSVASMPVGSAAMPRAGNSDYYANHRYRGEGIDGGRSGYGASTNRNPSCMMDNYPPEPQSQYLHDSSNSRYDDSAPPNYGATSMPSIRHPSAADSYRPYAAPVTSPPLSTPCWDDTDGEQMSQHMGEQPLSPRTFKRECQRAFKEARAQRMRNLEEGLYGKCDWATFDAKYC